MGHILSSCHGLSSCVRAEIRILAILHIYKKWHFYRVNPLFLTWLGQTTPPDSLNICDNGGFFTDIIACLNFQKETICHQSLLKKLSSHGIRGKEQAWRRTAKSRKEKWGCTVTSSSGISSESFTEMLESVLFLNFLGKGASNDQCLQLI